MQIEDFEDSPTHLMVVVHDGDRQAVVVLEKGTGQVVAAEAVGGKDAAECFSFADEAAAWLTAASRPKRLTASHAA